MTISAQLQYHHHCLQMLSFFFKKELSSAINISFFSLSSIVVSIQSAPPGWLSVERVGLMTYWL